MFAIGVTLLIFVNAVRTQYIPENPCPNFFQYRQEGRLYYGEITIPYDGSKVLNLAVNISMPGLYQNAKLKVELLTPSEKILSSPVLLYRVNFPYHHTVPRITQITFNGQIFCYGPSEPVNMNGVTNLWSNLVYRIHEYTYNIQNGLQLPQNPSQNYQFTSPPHQSSSIPINQIPQSTPKEEDCGVVNDIQTLVLKGEKTVDNEFPWLVAMFHHQGVSYEFQCTANLISDRHVVTAAHCVWFYKAPLINKEDILLVMGRSDISHWASTGAIIRTALAVIPHPNYEQGSGHCDIAIIKLNEEVTFRPSVRPICLWSGETNLKQVAGGQGIVAGWGKSENKNKAVTKPRKVAMPIVTQETCLRSHQGFKNLTSEMTFCAGNRDGSGPCSGDSGAGFVLKRNGRWYLRGVVSTAIKNVDFTCNLNEYIVFSDVAKMKEWIKSVMAQ